MSKRTSSFKQAAEQPIFADEEQKILDYWNSFDAFRTSLKQSEGRPPYTFYDGPPFATGLPHYGHITAGTLKDVVTRYAHQNGYHVERRFGWDCHGLPIEFEIDKMEGINTKQDVLKIGIAEYNKKCRSIVMRFAGEWERYVSRLGRWIDFDNDYKTMDINYMESCWNVFQQIYNKDLVYRSSRVMPYSVGCNTVLSNFEANLNYMDVKDPSVYITFPLISEPNTSILAWTTTPWTLPSNLAFAMHPELNYVKIQLQNSEQCYIVNEQLLPSIVKVLKLQNFTKLETFPGSQLHGLEYEPLFNYFEHMKESGCFKVYTANFVTNESGTGIVHCAPFGEEDFKLFVQYGLVRPDNPPDPLDENGHFNSMTPDLEGMYFKDANDVIKQNLKNNGRIIHISQHNHSYPFCWRSKTPLIYRPVKSWFIKVESIKQDLLKNNMDSKWVPSFVQEKRFHNWLEDARDWCFSRSRFWGCPIPLWVSDDFEEVICIGSIKELEELTGTENITDIHRESVDHLTIPSRQGKGELRRIEEVFDCWFESGSMPYAQCHYPFTTSEEEFAERFPADFIAEGLDQTRGWFYTLLVLGTALKNQCPFKNVIVNGIALASDGTKMSKSKGNYPDPMDVINKYSADSVRLYLASSGLVKAESLKFSEDGVRGMIKEVFLPWYNSYRLLLQSIARYENTTNSDYRYDPNSKLQSQNFLDRWIVAATQNLIKFFRTEMDNYRLYTVVPVLLKFLTNLSNWYIRLNRLRLKGEASQEDWKYTLDILYDTLLNLTVLLAPFTPFMTETIYQNLKYALPEDQQLQSVHYQMIPQYDENLTDTKIESSISNMQIVFDLARSLREKRAMSFKVPVFDYTIVHRDLEFLQSLEPVVGYMQLELNAQQIHLVQENNENVKLTALPNNKVLGLRLKRLFNAQFRQAVASLSHAQLLEYERTQQITVMEVELGEGDLILQRKSNNEDPSYEGLSNDDVVVVLNCNTNDELQEQGTARDVASKIQKIRKEKKLGIDDVIQVYYSEATPAFDQLINNHNQLIGNILKVQIKPIDQKTQELTLIEVQEFSSGESTSAKLHVFADSSQII